MTLLEEKIQLTVKPGSLSEHLCEPIETNLGLVEVRAILVTPELHLPGVVGILELLDVLDVASSVLSDDVVGEYGFERGHPLVVLAFGGFGSPTHQRFHLVGVSSVPDDAGLLDSVFSGFVGPVIELVWGSSLDLVASRSTVLSMKSILPLLGVLPPG